MEYGGERVVTKAIVFYNENRSFKTKILVSVSLFVKILLRNQYRAIIHIVWLVRREVFDFLRYK